MDIKFKKLFKTMVIFFVVFVMIFNSFAAISVSDGSAFVTKAEFSADLNNLSNRMSALENSIDAKIDSLVSSYLSRNGIWNGEKQTLALTNKVITLKSIMSDGTYTKVDAYYHSKGAALGTYTKGEVNAYNFQSNYINELGFIVTDISKTGLMGLTGDFASDDSNCIFRFYRITNNYGEDGSLSIGFNYRILSVNSKGESDAATYKWELDIMQNPAIYVDYNSAYWYIPKTKVISYFFVSKGEKVRAVTESYCLAKSTQVGRIDGAVNFKWESASVY